MTAKWQAGHTYVPGDLVVPSTSSITTPTLTNADFESGDTGWDKTGTWSVDATGVPYHGSWDATATASGEIINQSSNNIAAGIEVTASCAVKSAGTTGTNMQVMIVWYDGSGVRLSGQEALGNGNTLHDTQQISTVTAKAPASAKTFRVGAKATIIGTGGIGTNYSVCDYFSVSCAQSVPKGLVFKATQANPGKSGSGEPTWPATTGISVTDNEVTWEGVIATRVVWEAQPLLKSGSAEPTWPDSDDGAVHDNIIDWQALTPRVTDTLLPQSKIVTIAANKVFVGDGDVVRYCATNDATDWHSEQDAGYLPTGLQAVGETQCTALGIYRGNVVAWTASSMEVWQVDPDPSRMAIIDTVEGVGTTFVRAAIGMMNDLFFLSPLGVRSVSTSATTGTMGAADVGSPVDPLVVAAINTATAAGIEPVGVFYSNASQFWIFLGASAFVYTISQATGIKAWSRYTFPWSVTHACVKDGQLYVRTTGNDVYVLDESQFFDDLSDGNCQAYQVTAQWPWLDLGASGIEKMLVGCDVVFDESDEAAGGNTPAALPTLVVTGDLPGGRAGSSVSYSYQYAGAVLPATFSLASGALPPGTTLSSSGAVSGTLATAGTYSWTVRVTDFNQRHADLADSATVAGTNITAFATYNALTGSSQTTWGSDVAAGVIAVTYSNGNLTYSSNNGASWTAVSGLVGGFNVQAVKSFNGRWYVFNSNTWASAGANFVFSGMANGPFAKPGSLCVANGKLLCGEGSSTTTTIYEMVTPGSAWTAHSLGGNYGFAQWVAWTGTAYLVGTDTGYVCRSTGLSTWAQVAKFAAGVNQIAVLGSVIIAATTGGAWSRSTDDGVTWTAATSTPQIAYVTATPTMLLGGRGLNVYTSTDGVTWTGAYTATLGSQFTGPWSTDGFVFAAPIQSSDCVVGHG